MLDYFFYSLLIASIIATTSVTLGIFIGVVKALMRKRRKP